MMRILLEMLPDGTVDIAEALVDGISNIAPAGKHYVLSQVILRLDLAGHDFTDDTKKTLTERGHSVTEKAGREIVCYTKAKFANIALDSESKLKAETANPVKRKTYELLDGIIIAVGSERKRCPELPVGYRLMIRRASDIHDKTTYTFLERDVDTRKVFYANMALPDFSTKITGTGKHVAQEFTALAPVTMKFEIVRPHERKQWLGSSPRRAQPGSPLVRDIESRTDDA
jgi:actin-related protein